MHRAAGASFKLRHPTTATTMQEVANWLTDIDVSADQDSEEIAVFAPGSTQPTKRTLYGAISRGFTLSVKWNATAEVFFQALQGLTNVPFEYAPLGTAAGNILRSGAVDVGGWAGPGGSATGSLDATITLACVTAVLSETIPASAPTTKTITTSSVADPTLITTSAAHLLSVGSVILIAGHTGSTPALNGYHTVTAVPSSTTFNIPVSVTVGGTGGTVQD